MSGLIKKIIYANKKGSILPFVMSVVILLFIIGLALTRLGLNARLTAAKTVAEISARAAADAGFTHASRLLNKELATRTWDGTPIADVVDASLPNSYSTFSYNITKNGGYYEIISTGKSGIAEKVVHGTLVLETLNFGIGVREKIDVKVGATFTAPEDSGFAIRTNSISDNSIEVKAGVTIPGDIICGPGGDTDDVVNIKSTTMVLGDTYSAPDEIDFPEVVLPGDLASAPAIIYNYQNGVPIVGSADPCNPAVISMNELQIPSQGVQEIQGHCKVYVVGETTLGQSAELIITEGASLEMYLGGDMEAKNSNGIDNLNSEMPEALQIYGLPDCEHIDLKAKGDVFFGYVYAPNADLDVYAKNELAGAFTGKSFTLKNSADFRYIPHPGQVSTIDPTSYLMARWWEE